MKTRDYRDYINDILESINNIEEFIKDITFENFIYDKKTLNAVIRCIEIIGEAAKHIPEDIKKKSEGIPWQEIMGMRNKLAHEYFGIDYEIVWKTAKDYLPKLKIQILEIKGQLSQLP